MKPLLRLVPSMSNDKGTPRFLDEAILNAITIGPLSETQERLYHHVRDFMAQKFGIAFLGTKNNDADELLKSLFEA